jgi:hypothetical protein
MDAASGAWWAATRVEGGWGSLGGAQSGREVGARWGPARARGTPELTAGARQGRATDGRPWSNWLETK